MLNFILNLFKRKPKPPKELKTYTIQQVSHIYILDDDVELYGHTFEEQYIEYDEFMFRKQALCVAKDAVSHYVSKGFFPLENGELINVNLVKRIRFEETTKEVTK